VFGAILEVNSVIGKLWDLLGHSEEIPGWQSDRELDFEPSNPGLTSAQVPTTKKKEHQSRPVFL